MAAVARSSDDTRPLYVQNGTPSSKARHDRHKGRRTLNDFLCASFEGIVDLLVRDGFINQLEGTLCPRCGVGRLSRLKHTGAQSGSVGHLRYECKRASCRARILPTSNHRIFNVGSGAQYVTLQKQAAVLFCLISGSTQTLTAKLLGVDHKTVERISVALDEARMEYVVSQEARIQFGGGDQWADVEADEVDLAKGTVDKEVDQDRKVRWEQWCGVVQRGVRQTLLLFRLSPELTKERAPGPGPIRTIEWTPFAMKHLQNRRVVLHTDGARAYKAHVPGMLHDHVVHMKKRVIVDGRARWMKPFFTKRFDHVAPDGNRIACIGGTQTIDRFWRTLRGSLIGRSCAVGSHAFVRRIRSCQWEYWFKGKDLWVKTGDMLQALSAMSS